MSRVRDGSQDSVIASPMRFPTTLLFKPLLSQKEAFAMMPLVNGDPAAAAGMGHIFLRLMA
jgi:hypothetical protein